MFAMGMGRGNPRMRNLRLGLIAMIVLAGIVFHHHGKAYEAVRILYYLAIVGFLVYAYAQRKRVGQNAPGGARRVPWNQPLNAPQNNGPFSQQQPVQAPIETRLVEKETPGDTHD